MSSYFPYNEDEWEKIVEQAFAADAAEPQFSKAYQRRKHRMERKMMRTRFGQSPRRHSRKGMKSCILAALSFLLLVFMIWISFCLKGNVNILVGFAGLFTMVMAGYGIYQGVTGLRERDKNYITCKVGIAVCSALFLGMCAIFIRGLV